MVGFWFVVVLSFLHSSNGEYYTLKVEPQTEECFYEDLKEGSNVNFEYHVFEGGLLDIDVKVFKGTALIFQKLHFEGKEFDNIYNFVSETGTYGFCFNNEMSRFTVKVISFSIHIPKTHSGSTPIQNAIATIEENFEKIERQQQQYRIREHMHRDTAEETNTRVTTWSLMSAVLIMMMCFGQIFYIRRLFSDKRR